MVPKDWKRFGKLIAVRIVNKDINKNIQDCIELNFEYSNSKILYKSEKIQNFDKFKEKIKG